MAGLGQGIKKDLLGKRLQKLLGLPVDRPSWQITALENGWTPPYKIEEV